MQRCWTIFPTSDEIVKDILGFVPMLEKVVSNQGIVCPEDFLCSGHRALRHEAEKLP